MEKCAVCRGKVEFGGLMDGLCAKCFKVQDEAAQEATAQNGPGFTTPGFADEDECAPA